MLSNGAKVGIGVLIAIAIVVVIFLTGIYTQSENEAKVIKGFSGTVSKVDVAAGLGYAWPGSEEIDYDLVNQQVVFSKTAENRNGPHITTTDKSGVPADYDVTVTYSIEPTEANVQHIYNEYQTQDSLEVKLVNDNIRAIVRQAPGKYTTEQVLGEKRGQLEVDITEALTKRVEGSGIKIDRVSLQEVIYDQGTMDKFRNRNNATTGLETAKIEAEQKRIEAEGTAEANRILERSLSSETLEQKWIDAQVKMAEHGTVFVVPEGSQPMIQTQPKG